MQKLTTAREKRGWSLTRTARETGVPEQSLRNLERIGHTRETLPSQVTLMTAASLLETFTELDLADFVPGTPLRLRVRR